MMQTIQSIKHEKVELARAVKTRKGRQETGRILLEGEEILDWAFENGLDFEYILANDKTASEIETKYRIRCQEIYQVSEGILKKVTGTNYVIPVVGVGKLPEIKVDFISPFVVVLDAVQDFGNIGTIIRTCQAFGVKQLIGTASDFDLFQRKTIEASRGSVFGTHLQNFAGPEQTLTYLKEQGYQIVATSPRGDNLQSLIELKQKPVALVIGNETNGINQEFEKHADFLIQIPMAPAVESLNAGVAAGISIYEIRLKQVLAMIEQQIKSTLGRELNVAGMLVQQALNAELQKVSNLTSQQVIFMMVLKCDEKMSIENMCKQFGLLEAEVDTFLKPMLDASLILRSDVLTMTPKGEEVLGKLWFTIEATESKILAGFSSEEIILLKKRLRMIQEKSMALNHGDSLLSTNLK